MFETLGKFLRMLNDAIAVASDWIGMTADSTKYVRDKLDSELDLARKEDEVDLKVRTAELDQKLEQRIKELNLDETTTAAQ